MSDPSLENSSNMSGRKIFELIGSAAADGSAARLGKLSLPGRKAIETPNFFAVTSRGAVPHVTPDNLRKHTSVGGVYMALEDFIEKKEPPVQRTPGGENSRRLHQFTALPSNTVSVLGPRRCPAVTTPFGNTPKALTVFTSTGFRSVTVPEFTSAVQSLQPDIVLPMADLPHTSTTPASKKLVRMVERTEVWLDEFLDKISSTKTQESLDSSVFAPVLPVEYPIQWDYLRHLSEDVLERLSGLAVYDTNLLPELVNYPPLLPLPKLSMDPPKTPHEVLRQVSLGTDICTMTFANSISDAGVAMTFSFPPPSVDAVQPLGINMWSTEHQTAVVPLSEGCQCYTCSKHHRAYLHHLLNAKEMLGWNLLQIHNHHVISEFFSGIREALGKGPAVFEEDVRKFTASYEPLLPEGTGERPRARGYHFKSEASSEKINKPAWIDLDKGTGFAQITSLAESGTPSGDSQDATPAAVVNVEAAAAALSLN
ncbi:trna-guanine transglycosylase family [Trichoderma arundinaceum]|uniref:Queuine tRNA-ribosyltransferase accessory subunit 2 n=1 Tax=Trichoderma arundinaceum TaxID=490622 RepID=A0A395NC40_TRIAR|nr:trna-guanine transglycosylase family [Trichoderma arundinaceum]